MRTIILILVLISVTCYSCRQSEHRNELLVEREELHYESYKGIKFYLQKTNDRLVKQGELPNNYKLIRTDTKELISFLDSIQKHVIEVSGGYKDEFIRLKNPSGTESINHLFFSPESSEFQTELKEKLLSYENKYEFIQFHMFHKYDSNQPFSIIPKEKRATPIRLLLGNHCDVIQCLIDLTMLEITILESENEYYIDLLIEKDADTGV